MGRAVVKRLVSDGHQVVLLDGRDYPVDLLVAGAVSGRTFESEPLRAAMLGCEAVVHLEWSGAVHEATVDPLGTHERNTTGSLNLLEACRRQGARFLFASSAVYAGESPEPSREDARPSTRSLYAIQKLYVERALAAYVRNFGIEGASLRLFNVYGEGGRETHIVPRILQALRTGAPISLTGDGGQMRDFVHLDDVAAAFSAALRAPNLQGEAINVGTGTGTSLLDLSRTLMRLAGREVEIRFGPARGEESRYLIADPAYAANRLGWRAQVGLEEGLGRMIAAS